jgi:hypothetical protein
MKVRSENAHEKARRILPVLVYNAMTCQTLTYGELGAITGDHQRSFRPAFALIHDWIEERALRETEEALPLATIVLQKGRSLPGAGAIRWRLRKHNLPINVDQPVIEALFADERKKIFEYSRWKEMLDEHKLKPYVPSKRPIEEITKELSERRYGGESPAHRRLKYFISKNPRQAKLPPESKLKSVEFILPSLDRVDVMFEHAGVLFAVEVKSEEEADDLELLKGLYQTVKYKALSKAFQKDRNLPPLAHSCLVTSRTLTPELRERARLLNVDVIEGIRVPKDFTAPA